MEGAEALTFFLVFLFSCGLVLLGVLVVENSLERNSGGQLGQLFLL